MPNVTKIIPIPSIIVGVSPRIIIASNAANNGEVPNNGEAFETPIFLIPT